MSNYPGKACSSSCTCRKSSNYKRNYSNQKHDINKWFDYDSVERYKKAKEHKRILKEERSKKFWEFISEFMNNLLGK
jgi:hypothetical protein